jgi:serine/threonine protein kinase/predicted hydrocarbon binding protein
MARTQAQSGNDQRMIGKTVAGRYSLVRLLGDGGMGAVYKAEDNVLRRFVALKLLHSAAAANPATVERFLREAQAAASIGHPNVIDILDFGDAEGKPYLVMEYLRGRSLAEVLHAEGPMTVRRACVIATHALAGLQAAHDRGILHRDLKPANLMLTHRYGDRSFVKLLDFGFAALLSENASPDRSLTPARTLVGTPAYAAPERLRGDDRRDARTDLYSLGVVLFEMLAGVRPFDAGSFADLARKVQNDPPPPLRLYRPDAPEALERVVFRALSKTLEDRFPKAEAFAAALVPFGGRAVETDDSSEDSLAMDLLKLRARERVRHPRIPAPPPRGPALPASSTEAHLEQLQMDRGIEAPAPSERRGPPPLPTRTRPESFPEETIRMAAPFADYDEAWTAPPPPAPDSPPAQPVRAQSASDLAAARTGVKSKGGVQLGSAAALLPGEPCVDGSMGIALLRYVSLRYGERALKVVLEALPSPHAQVFAGGIARGNAVPLNAMLALADTVDSRLGRDDLLLVADCGRAIAEGTIEYFQNLSQGAPPPELLLAEMPSYLASLMQGTSCRVRSIGRGYGRIELDEGGRAPSLTLCVLVLGILDRTLTQFGAREVEVNLLSCRYLGDEENLYDISWLIV